MGQSVEVMPAWVNLKLGCCQEKPWIRGGPKHYSNEKAIHSTAD